MRRVEPGAGPRALVSQKCATFGAMTVGTLSSATSTHAVRSPPPFPPPIVQASGNEVRTLREMLNNSSRSSTTKPDITHGAVAVEQVHAQLRSMADSTMRIQGDVSLCHAFL